MGRYSGKKCRLMTMFGLTASFFLVEIIVGHVTNSMALISDSFHMLSDIAAIIIAFVSVRMAPQSWDKNTYGWARAEVLGALVNAVFLVALCFSITMEALKRFYEPETIHDPQLIFWVGCMGLVVNLLGLCLFHEHGSHSHGGSKSGHGHSHGVHGDHGAHSHLAALADHEDNQAKIAITESKGKSSPKGTSGAGALNMRGVFLHVMADALGSVIVIISAVIMWQTQPAETDLNPDEHEGTEGHKGTNYVLYVDPALSLIMVMLMLRSVWPLLIESALILLQTVPTHIDIETLKRRLLEHVDGIHAVHEFHVWQLAGDRIIASAHIKCLNLSEYMKVAEKIKEFFHHEGIHSTTIQPEFVDFDSGEYEYDRNSETSCAIGCPKDPAKSAPDCEASKCCPLPPPSYSQSKDFPELLLKSDLSSAAARRRQSSVSLDSPEVHVQGLHHKSAGDHEAQSLT